MIKWFLRIVLGLAAAAAVLIVGVLTAFFIWKAGFIRAQEAGSQVAQTARGEIEYAIDGEGAPMLYVHGTPGGYDQGLADRKARADAFAGLQIITASRPGFLRTPLSSGETPAEQADLYAALLDELGVERVVVVAVSGGGPAGVQFAIRHPDRISALVMIAPLLTRSEEEAQAPSNGAARLATDMALWALGGGAVANFIPELDMDEPEDASIASSYAMSMVPAARHVDGWVNDFAQFRAMDLEAWNLEAIAAPTLIIHGENDPNAPYAGSVAAAARIPDAELIPYRDAGHEFVLTQAREIDADIERFLDAHGL